VSEDSEVKKVSNGHGINAISEDEPSEVRQFVTTFLVMCKHCWWQVPLQNVTVRFPERKPLVQGNTLHPTL
jgi:hypothetical protein